MPDLTSIRWQNKGRPLTSVNLDIPYLGSGKEKFGTLPKLIYRLKQNRRQLLQSMSSCPLILRSRSSGDLSEEKKGSNTQFFPYRELIYASKFFLVGVGGVTETEMMRLSIMSTRSDTMRNRASAKSQSKRSITFTFYYNFTEKVTKEIYTIS